MGQTENACIEQLKYHMRRLHRFLVLAITLLNACSESKEINVLQEEKPRHEDVISSISVCDNGKVETGELCDDGTNDRLGGGCLPACRESDNSDSLFEQSLVDITISMPENEWDALRMETKTTVSAFGSADCRTRESAKPYQWYHGDISIDGKNFGDIGFRKKGHFGSQSTLKPSLKIRLDKYRSRVDYLGLERFALNNSIQDPSYMRGCLSYDIFRNGGIPAPRCTLARVSVNGVDKGVFVLVEEIKKDFLSRNFENDKGTLYEGETADFRPEYFGAFEQETNEGTDPSRPYLNALYDVINDTKDAKFIEELSTVLNVDKFFRFWAIEGLIWHRDGYSGNVNNYFVYEDPNDDHRFQFFPWGIDTSMMPDNRKNHPVTVHARGKLTNRLIAIEEGRHRYFQELDNVLSQLWDTEDVLAKIVAYEKTVLSVIPEQESNNFLSAVADLRLWVSNRKNAIEEELDSPDRDWDRGLRTSPCRVLAGTVSGSFSTRWDSLSLPEFSIGEVSMSLSLLAKDHEIDVQDIVQSGSSAGLNSQGRHQISMLVDTSNEKRYRVTAVFPNTTFFESYWVSGKHTVGFPPFRIVVTVWDRSSSTLIRLNTYELGKGQFSLDDVSSQPDGKISGTFNASAYTLGD